MKLSEISNVARKFWTKKKWDEYLNTPLYSIIKESVDLYENPMDEEFDCMLDRGKWKATVDRKVNYLLGRPPTCTNAQQEFDSLAPLIRDTARQLLLRGSVIWVVQGDGGLDLKPQILPDSINIYEDAEKQDIQATIRRYVRTSIDPATGSESEMELFECYFRDERGIMVRDTFCYSNPAYDEEVALGKDVPAFIDVSHTGTAPLYAYGKGLLEAFNRALKHQDVTTDKNTKPLIEVRGYSGTSDEDLSQAIENLSIVKTDGTGGVTIHTRTMDAVSIETWEKRLLQEWNEVMSVVGKENELQYAMSGKAMDRLFVDMENSAQELGHTIEMAIRQYFRLLGKDVDVIWNTDRPTDDASTISAIAQSRGIISTRTLLEQHPWVTDVDEELKRLNDERLEGFEDLLDPNDQENTDI